MRTFSLVAVVAGFSLQGCFTTLNGEMIDPNKLDDEVAKRTSNGETCNGAVSSGGFGYSYTCSTPKADDTIKTPKSDALIGAGAAAIGVVVAVTGNGSGT